MNRPFRYLFRHFLRGLFDTGISAGGDSRLGLATTLSLLAVPGAIISISMFPKYSALIRFLRRQFVFNPDLTSMPDKYMFIVLSMTVTGIVAVLKWDSLFPDRRDFANLAPLPIGTRAILLAKFLALAAFGLIFVVDVNAISSFVFPLIVMENRGTFGEVLRFLFSHIVAVSAAGLWTFATFLAITGTMMAVLPYAIFRRAKRYVQFLSLVALLLLFFSNSVVWPELAKLSKGGSSWAEWLPPVWFLGLYHAVQGKAMGSLNGLEPVALNGLLGAFALATIAYGSSYRWFYLKSAESSDVSAHALRFPDWGFRLLDRTVLRTNFDRACFRFVLKTLARSDRHTAVVTSLFGLGCALAVASVNYGAGKRSLALMVLPPSLILVYSLLTGLRLSFGVPSDMRANWMFQTGADENADPHAVAQRVMLLFVFPVIAATTLIFVVIWGAWFAVMHLLFLAATSLLLIELLMVEFRVIPFTCLWLPGGGNIVFGLAMFVVGLAVVGQGMAALEAALMTWPFGFIPFFSLVGGAVFALRRTRNARERIVFRDTRREFELLRIAE